MRRALLGALAAAALVASAPAHADFEAGVKALQARDFDGARAEFTTLASGGDHLAEFMLGVMAENGFGQAPDMASAAAWYRKSSDGGVASASYNLARLYQTGAGVEEDMEEARDLLVSAAEAGHGKAMHNLGRLYEDGELGDEPDLAAAWHWYAAAAVHLVNAERAAATRSLNDLELTIPPEDQAEGERRYEAWMSEYGKPLSAPEQEGG